jgi:hypothetical protein
VLPGTSDHPHGALLVLGSGSRANRQHALRIPLDADGRVHGPVQARETDALLAPLRQRFADLNIEGAFVQGDALCLLQRGHLGDPRSALIRLPLAAFLSWMDGDNAALPAPSRVDHYLLDTIDGVPLALTDGAPLEGGGWLFSAVAERTSDSYEDGGCVACAVGCVAADGRIAWVELLDGAPKVEGIAVHGRRLLMVTDADDAAQPSRLLAADLPAAAGA